MKAKKEKARREKEAEERRKAEILKRFQEQFQKDEANERKGGNESASDIIKNTKIQSKKSYGYQGIIDKFRGGINEHLQNKFQNETNFVQSGIFAIVELVIYKNGNFTYDIVRYSRNDKFNAKVKNFFKSLKKDEFQRFMNDFPKEDKNNFSMRVKVFDEE